MHAVKWMEVCYSKANVGLGIERVLDKNKVLLAKWIWRFGRENEALWRRVIASKYRIQDNVLVWEWNCSKADSFFVSAVHSLMKANSLMASLIDVGFKLVVGNGDRAYFLSEIKWDSKPMKEAFPRLYALAVQKEGVIQNFDLCVDSKKVKTSKIRDWFPPLMDNLKFNVDGSARGNLGPTGIWGVLRDLNEKVLCLFSYFVGSMDSNSAEILAIKKAVELCLSNLALQGCFISIVSDSKVAVSLINNGDLVA
ncbi:hypothetical protein Dsin_028041 [Dipteronia sinensis]|uniref:RNase H type-1 domain-containing protein n=1 Tax=Dipteronia sinensis TaxID=43782 RepID=A0AAD9ZQH6_9ROSI|nr:hypothetical protein Dsin_028041 [Dipteronia sinensis]